MLDGDRLSRNIKWLNYYKPLQEKLGYDDILLVDNASEQSSVDFLLSRFPQTIIIQKNKRLERLSEHAYGYWYRAFAEAAHFALENDYEKIIHIDSDVYLFNDRICASIKDISGGWNTHWSEMHGFPESTLQIIVGNSIRDMHQFMSEDFLEFYPYDLAETRIPWTNIEKRFIGDRYPEAGLMIQQPEWDYCGQVPVDMKVEYNG
jgi:hypothetical protein